MRERERDRRERGKERKRKILILYFIIKIHKILFMYVQVDESIRESITQNVILRNRG